MLNRRLAGLFTGFIDLAAFFPDTSFCFLRCERPGDQLVLFFALSLSFCRGKSCRISTSHRRRFTLFNRERLSVCRTLPRVYSPDFAAFRRLLIIGMLTLLTLLLKYDTKFCNWLCRVAGTRPKRHTDLDSRLRYSHWTRAKLSPAFTIRLSST